MPVRHSGRRSATHPRRDKAHGAYNCDPQAARARRGAWCRRGGGISRCPIVEAKKWIAVTGKLEFANDWEKTPLGGVFSLDWQLT